MKLATILFPLMIALSMTNVSADEAAEMSFSEGSVIIRCGTPPGQDNHISSKLFEAAFPSWMTSLQKHANDGLVSRAHYLGELKQGIFIVVVGENREQALENSEVVLSDLGKIMDMAMQETGEKPEFTAEESCLVGEIGPVAILPK